MSDVGLILFTASVALLIVAGYSLGLKGLDTSRVDISGEAVTIFWAIVGSIASVVIG